MQLFNLSILQGELEDFVFGLLLLFLIPFLGGIQQELIVGRPIFWFDDEQVDTTQPTFFQGDMSAQQRQQTEIAKDLLHANQIPLLLVFQAHAIGSNMLPQKIDADTLDLNFRIQFLFANRMIAAMATATMSITRLIFPISDQGLYISLQ